MRRLGWLYRHLGCRSKFRLLLISAISISSISSSVVAGAAAAAVEEVLEEAVMEIPANPPIHINFILR